ncbi:MAG: hypothetical protein K8I27_01275 [Planctomycetes bacterium]|nr:hypothetical protein [Planctomycetota bacterium]
MMPKLRPNVTYPKRRKLGDAMRPGESRAVTIVGVLLVVTIALWALNFLVRLSFPTSAVAPWVVTIALIGAVVFVALLVRAIRIGTEDQSGID